MLSPDGHMLDAMYQYSHPPIWPREATRAESTFALKMGGSQERWKDGKAEAKDLLGDTLSAAASSFARGYSWLSWRRMSPRKPAKPYTGSAMKGRTKKSEVGSAA